jgi:hypothetical protein
MDFDASANLDLLAWFADDERAECSRCGEVARVEASHPLAWLCLGCGEIWIDGTSVDAEHRHGA